MRMLAAMTGAAGAPRSACPFARRPGRTAAILRGRLFHRHELAALFIALGPGRRAAKLGLDLRSLLGRAFARIVADGFVDCHINNPIGRSRRR
jgi:hypothetical protein